MNKYSMGGVLFFLTITVVCSCKGLSEMATRRLFMVSKRATIELPPREEMLNGSNPGGAVLGEQVAYSHADNRSDSLNIQKNKETGGIEEIQHLDDVVVTAAYKQLFTPERDGQVLVDFIIRVPKEFLSDEWRLTLSPQLLHGQDSIVSLEPIVLKGQSFLDKQLADQLAWEEFLASIVGTEDYDVMFLDREGIARDMRKRQDYYYGLYNKQFRQVENYLSWRQMMEERYARSNTLQESNRLGLYHRLMRKGEEQAIRDWATGRDSTGVTARYQRKYERKAGFWPPYKLRRELNERTVPSRYRGFYKQDMLPGDVGNHTTTGEDSVRIARHRYQFAAIVENEMKEKRRSEKERDLLPYPLEADTRLNSITTGERDFVYYYSQPYPVSPGLSRIRVTMTGKVEAVDLSTYTLPQSDTLSYFISSLAELADTVAVKGGYMEGVRLLQERYYTEALQILQTDPGYNTALCLVCLGYNGKAYDMLSRMQPTGNSEYLLAIILKRLGESNRAKDRLLNALTLDPTKVLRVMTDTETADLIRQYRLQEQVRNAELAWLFLE